MTAKPCSIDGVAILAWSVGGVAALWTGHSPGKASLPGPTEAPIATGTAGA